LILLSPLGLEPGIDFLNWITGCQKLINNRAGLGTRRAGAHRKKVQLQVLGRLRKQSARQTKHKPDRDHCLRQSAPWGNRQKRPNERSRHVPHPPWFGLPTIDFPVPPIPSEVAVKFSAEKRAEQERAGPFTCQFLAKPVEYLPQATVGHPGQSRINCLTGCELQSRSG
jgi:hypothetical protein